MKNKIGVFDSGIGGLTTLEEIRKILPNEDFIYYADSKNNPYGSKTTEELESITKNIVNYLLEQKVKIIVVACNTATTRCIDYLRKSYPDTIFIGTVPAVKVSFDNNYKNTLLMATPATIKSDKTKELIDDFKKEDQNIYLLPCDNLANAIENKDDKLIDKLLKEYLTPYQNKNIDAIVLGCTHYPIIKDKIQKYFPYAKLLDGNNGVARRVKYQLEKHNILNNKTTNGIIKFIQTKK